VPPFEIIRRPSLPPLAWHFSARAGQRPQLIAGDAVEVFDDGFLEGCLAGPVAATDLDSRSNVFGSGMCLRDGAPWFVGPSHTLEALYVHRSPDGYAVSNSLPFIVEVGSLTLPADVDYAGRLATLVRGFDDYDPLISRHADWDIQRVVYDNFTCDARGAITTRRKPEEAPLADVDEYVRRLKSILRDAFNNAASPKRRATYQPLASCSTGYDSLTCTVLARDLGGRDAITIRRARGGDDDNGAPLGTMLGMRVVEVDRKTTVSFDEAAEFLATGMGGEDVALLNFEPHLGGRILLTGFHGDRVWNPNQPPAPTLGRDDVVGSSLQEFRLRVGFIHIPVPMILARQHQRILELSRGAQMSGYTVHGDYDRPIPRRTIERAGVPRGAFANRKRAVSTLIFSTPRLLTELPVSPARAHGQLLHSMIWNVKMLAVRALVRLPGGKRLRDAVVGDWRIFEHAHPRNSALFVAAVEHLRGRYRLPAAPLTSRSSA
jgi:hypothetical protein